MSESQTQIVFSPSFAPTDEQLDKLKMIQALPLGDVRSRVAEQGSLPESILEDAVTEYRKFLFLAACGYRHELAMCSEAVDEVWHTHILFTEAYVRDCNQILGRYLHHKPQLGENWGDKERVAGFCELYQQVFGELPTVWRASANCNTIVCSSATCVGGTSICSGN